MPSFTSVTNFLPGFVTSAKMNTVRDAITELQGAVPAGLLLTKTMAADRAVTGATPVAVTDFTDTFVLTAPRIIALGVRAELNAGTAGQYNRFYVTINGSTFWERRVYQAAVGGGGRDLTHYLGIPQVLTAGTHTLGGAISQASGSGVFTLISTSFVQIFDLGAA